MLQVPGRVLTALRALELVLALESPVDGRDAERVQLAAIGGLVPSCGTASFMSC